ncbi:MAG: pyoverdine responsive serine/threonine kinase [Labilithrix sp.]|nr:pyoverdine responsive serine/threonine kinase [Labilithrix sp.]
MALAIFTGCLAGAAAVACGIDVVATKEFPAPDPDAAVPDEASLPPGGDSGAGDAAGDAAVDAGAGCPTTHGAMVLVDAGGMTFCIDGTEVTNAAYDTFLAATDGGNVTAFDAGDAASCANDSFVPFPPLPPPQNGATYPVVNIDYCDALSYCRWAGKRLCGRTTGADASTGEWYAACSAGGTRAYAYGGTTRDATKCNDGTGAVAPTASFPGCQGSVPGLFDMNGNVGELIDQCSDGFCTVVGGSYVLPSSCLSAVAQPAPNGAATIGFRCCSDPASR